MTRRPRRWSLVALVVIGLVAGGFWALRRGSIRGTPTSGPDVAEREVEQVVRAVDPLDRARLAQFVPVQEVLDWSADSRRSFRLAGASLCEWVQIPELTLSTLARLVTDDDEDVVRRATGAIDAIVGRLTPMQLARHESNEAVARAIRDLEEARGKADLDEPAELRLGANILQLRSLLEGTAGAR